MNTIVIANPRSANGAVAAHWPRIAADLRRTLGPFEERLTRAPREATQLAREAIAAGAELVVALGGDGTIHEVANGFFPAPGSESAEAGRAAQGGDGPVLGIIPYGTGGDLRRTLGLPTDVVAAARIVRDGTTRSLDAGTIAYRTPDGRAATRRFVNIASFGVSGLVDSIVNRSSKALGGRLSFLVATLRAQASWTNQRVRLRFDEVDEEEGPIHTVAVANGRYFGGGMKIAPDAEPDDGLFDVVTLGDLTPLEVLLSGPRVYRGTHVSLAKVSVRRARRVDAEPVTRGAELLLDVDGEQPGLLPASFTLERAALRVRLPALPSARS